MEWHRDEYHHMKGVKTPHAKVPKKPGLKLPKIGLSAKGLERPKTADILKRIGATKGTIT
jgi:hypothetical protein